MLGCSGTGCFIMGIAIGFILAGILGLFIVFQCNPDLRDSTRATLRQIWGSVRSGVDSTLDTPPPRPPRPVEPQKPEAKPAPRGNYRPGSAPRTAAPAAPRENDRPAPVPRSAAPAAPQPAGQPLPRARIEINL